MPPPDRVRIWDRRTGLDAVWAARLRETCAQITAGPDRLRENYAYDRLDIEGHETFDALVDSATGAFIAFAGVYRREFWPEGVYRVQNRSWINPAYRRSSERYPPCDPRFAVNTIHLGAPQIADARRTARALFISIEGRRGIARLGYMAEHVAPRWNSGLTWQVSTRYPRMVQGSLPPCWQPVLYANTAPGYDLAREPWLRDALTFEQWSQIAC